jgi:hypothetical protein
MDVPILGRQKCDEEKSRGDFKYEKPTMEIRRVWNAKINVIPVVTEATGTISE